MRITTYEQAVKYLESFIGKVIFKVDPEYLKHHDPLERMRVLLNLLGNPQEKFKSILIGGTSGKSTTAYLISHILKTAGYKTGLTISPHLQKVNERLQINGQSISDGEFTKMVDSIVDTIELMKKMPASPQGGPIGEPSYFEILIAMAFLHFVKEKVDIAVVEVGMGGEFDATNTLYPLVSVLTNVSLDHTNVLGGTIQKIARTKAGIIKEIKDLRFKIYESNKNHKSSIINHKSIVVTGVKQPSVVKIVEDKCKEVRAELYRVGKDFSFEIKKESLGGSIFDLTTASDRRLQLNDLKLSLLGKHQVENASLAIETVLQLREFGFKISKEHIRKALKTAFFPGRFEVISIALRSLRQFKNFSNASVPAARYRSPRDTVSFGDSSEKFFHAKAPRSIVAPSLRIAHSQLSTLNSQLVLDGAHNPTKMKAFLTTLKKLYPKTKKIFIVGFKFDKDVKKMLKQIVQVADSIIITEFRAKTDISANASTNTQRILEDIKILRYYDIRKIMVERDSRKALDRALNILVSQYPNINPVIVVTGSLYLVGEVRNML